MECCLVNLLEPGDTCVVAVNGVFGGRMAEIVRRCGAKPVASAGGHVPADYWSPGSGFHRFYG